MFFEERIEELVAEFYRLQLQHAEIEVVIGDADTLSRLQNSMHYYVLDLFCGHYDEYYVTSRLRVGKVHKRIGVSPSLYMAGVSILWGLLTKIIESEFLVSNGQEESRLLLKSLSKLLMFDVQLVFETYTRSLVAEVEKAKQEVEQYSRDLELEVAERTQELETLSRYDHLTGLLNQRAFYEQLRTALSTCKRRKEPLTLAYFDLNGFKEINDQKGHYEGDKILKQTGEIIIKSIRGDCCGARYGGDEFCLIFPFTTNEEAKTIICRLIQGYQKSTYSSQVTFSMGILQTGPETYMVPDELVKQADKRMYQAKEAAKKDQRFYLCDTDFKLVPVNIDC